jgi:hypothetical protein
LSRIVLVTHTHDNFRNRNSLLKSLAGHWVDSAHEVSLVEGLRDWPEGDLAIMHVDLSLIPDVYSEACKRYPVVINGSATDIRKRRVSRNLVGPGDGWTGPVIIKTDLNYGGIPEWNVLQQSNGEGPPADLPSGPIVSTDRPYPILRSSGQVPMEVWSNPGLVVERFLPEQDAQGFWTRAWVFFGDRERCTRYLSNAPIVKTSGILARESVPVPDELRAERERLGFDYGKFDFVVRDGKAILLDANRTPSAPPSNPDVETSNANLARGLESFLRKLA